ncbi:hypothetical protein BGO18_04175 [Candidatus Saccharibacteria bacterium 47-87]|jgi:Tfp pilus assembly protein PilN|nr:hypothetical protein [Candidatus Saccharibacteria bacterium]OJU97330.1 MAG: hypothetical protein BGO18_04175 [Candidatus Saccharibacteria bacterium 47-87]
MINLLATDQKAEIKAARTNLLLVRYIGLILIAFAFIGGALYISYSVLEGTKNNTESLITASAEKANIYHDTQAQVETLNSQLGAASTAFTQEVRYSSFLVKLGQVMPPGTILGELALNESNFNGTPFELKAYAKTTTEASSLQSQLQVSPLFSKVTPLSTGSDQGIDKYPVQVKLSVTLNKAGI